VSTPSAPASERERNPTPIERLLVWARHSCATQSPAGQVCRCIRRRPATIETSEPSFAIAQQESSDPPRLDARYAADPAAAFHAPDRLLGPEEHAFSKQLGSMVHPAVDIGGGSI
jgi:hypothetical protein